MDECNAGFDTVGFIDIDGNVDEFGSIVGIFVSLKGGCETLSVFREGTNSMQIKTFNAHCSSTDEQAK